MLHEDEWGIFWYKHIKLGGSNFIKSIVERNVALFHIISDILPESLGKRTKCLVPDDARAIVVFCGKSMLLTVSVSESEVTVGIESMSSHGDITETFSLADPDCIESARQAAKELYNTHCDGSSFRWA